MRSGDALRVTEDPIAGWRNLGDDAGVGVR